MSEIMHNEAKENEMQTQDTEEQVFIQEESPIVEARRKWSAFVEGAAADFFTGYKLEKMTIDDGSGNKAKFSRTKDEGIKVEYTSAVLL